MEPSTTVNKTEGFPREQKSLKARRHELAPLASLEDLEEFKPPKISNSKKNCLPVIDDYETQQPEPSTSRMTARELEQLAAAVKSTQQPRPGPIRPIAVTAALIQDSGGGTGGTGGTDNVTPPTPRIDISCASSSSTISDEMSSSEKEMRRYGLGVDCKEEHEDLRSSTEEIAFEESNTAAGLLETAKRQIIIENLRRGSHPANIFSRKYSTVANAGEDFTRKPSVYSLHADAFSSSRAGRHTPGSEIVRPKSCAPSPTPTCRSGRRSISPHLMMFETSFCGSRPNIVDSDPEIYSPHVITTSSEVQVHSIPCDLPSGKAQIDFQQGQRPPQSPISSGSPTTPKLPFNLRSLQSDWCERFVIPNQPSMEEPDDDNSIHQPSIVSSEKVRLDSHIRDDTDQVILKCTKDESTDFSDKDNKFDEENISSIGQFDICTTTKDEVQINSNTFETPSRNVFLPPNDMSTPGETKGFILEDEEGVEDLEDTDLPFIPPTILPQQKSAALPIVPIKDRAAGYYVPTTPIQRPRATTPRNPTSIQDYISTVTQNSAETITADPSNNHTFGNKGKMKISLPRDESVGDDPTPPPSLSNNAPIITSRTPKKELPATTWTDFAEMGLRSNPRSTRRQEYGDSGTK